MSRYSNVPGVGFDLIISLLVLGQSYFKVYRTTTAHKRWDEEKMLRTEPNGGLEKIAVYAGGCPK